MEIFLFTSFPPVNGQKKNRLAVSLTYCIQLDLCPITLEKREWAIV